jgi:hypothetical protein
VDGGRLHAVMWKIRDPSAANLAVEAKDDFTLIASNVNKAAKVRPSPRNP